MYRYTYNTNTGDIGKTDRNAGMKNTKQVLKKWVENYAKFFQIFKTVRWALDAEKFRTVILNVAKALITDVSSSKIILNDWKMVHIYI